MRSANPARKGCLCLDANRPIEFPFIFMNEIDTCLTCRRADDVR